MNPKTTLSSATILAALCLTASGQSTYLGNGASGFGSPVGSGNLMVSDTSSSLTLTFNRGTGAFNDDLVLYLDTQSGGFADTSAFGDNGDGGRTAISGANNGNPSRSLETFAPGFGADYAISIENGFIGVFQLAAGGNNSLNFLFGQSQSGNNSDASYSFTMSAAQMAQIGLIAGSGQTFNFDGTLISSSAYRSNETIGNSVTVPGDGPGNAGFNNPQTFLQSLSYTLVPVPEPSSLALFGMSGLASFFLLHRRR